MNVKNLTGIENWCATINTGTTQNVAVLNGQIGRMTVGAISGGRFFSLDGATVLYPVSSGYHVAVTLTGADDYTVRRILVRAGKVTVKAEAERVYCDQISDVAYQMSCYKDGE